MQESYQNSSDGLIKTKKALENLEIEKKSIIIKINSLKSQLSNYEVTTNKSCDYKGLQEKYEEYNNLKDSLKVVKQSISNLKDILKEKQKLTNNCVIALKQIKQSQNVPHAITIYNDNVNKLNKLSNNFATQVKNDNEVVINSYNTNNTNATNNGTDTNTDNNTDINTNNTMNNTNSSFNNHNLREDILSYSAISAGALGVTTMAVGSSILGLSYIQTMAGICSLYPTYVETQVIITPVMLWSFDQPIAVIKWQC